VSCSKLDVEYQRYPGQDILGIRHSLRTIYAEVYSEPPYLWGDEQTKLFEERLEAQRQQDGFALVGARIGGELVGFTFGVTLRPESRWWSGLLSPVGESVTRESPSRTLAVVELLVRSPWRRLGIGKRLHDMLLADRPEERATLTVLPEARPAQLAYAKWGWTKVAQKRNPLPGAPVFDVLIKPLAKRGPGSRAGRPRRPR
jgi:GNAT superfamily N-acetyltransferase